MIIVIHKHDGYHPEVKAASKDRAMGHSQAEKARNRERILTEAAAQIRDGGLESISVGKLMHKVNLTHGGFYGHFASRSDLLAEALKRALAEGEAAARASQDHEKPRSFPAAVRSYLSRTHRDSRKTGCAIAALASDVGRADEASRAIMEEYVEALIASVARSLGQQDDSKAMVAVSAMVGALALSRVMTDPRRSDAMLRVVRDHVIALADEGPG
jgi:TetR/AcrR family transcriptional regulator, transcriptional repressor for nem operon